MNPRTKRVIGRKFSNIEVVDKVPEYGYWQFICHTCDHQFIEQLSNVKKRPDNSCAKCREVCPEDSAVEIPGFPDYMITESGQIWSKQTGKWLNQYWTGNRRDYLKVNLYNKSGQHQYRVHRLVCISFHGEPPFEGAKAAHRDDDRFNNHKDNIYWATRSENALDAHRNGCYD